MDEIFGTGLVKGEGAKVLSRPNMLGLYIAFDSYQYELIDDSQYIKGGDGGSSVCGGAGIFYVAPCYSAFYRETLRKGDRLYKNYYSYRRIIRP